MIPASYLKIRDRLELRVSTQQSDTVIEVRVQDITEEAIYIDRPIIDRRILPSRIGEDVELVFNRSDGTYRFITKVLEETYLGRLPVLKLAHPTELEKIQRRKHFRLDIDFPILFRRILSEKDGIYSNYKRGLLVDISGGGIKFRVHSIKVGNIQPGHRIQLTFNLTRKLNIIDMDAMVLQIADDPNYPKRSTVVARFLNVPTKIKEAIIIHNIRYQQRYRIEKK